MMILTRAELETRTLTELGAAGIEEDTARILQEIRWPMPVAAAIAELSARGLLVSVADLLDWIRETIAGGNCWPDGEAIESTAIVFAPKALEDFLQWALEHGRGTLTAIPHQVGTHRGREIARVVRELSESTPPKAAAALMPLPEMLAALRSPDQQTRMSAALRLSYWQGVLMSRTETREDLAYLLPVQVAELLARGVAGDAAAVAELERGLPPAPPVAPLNGRASTEPPA